MTRCKEKQSGNLPEQLSLFGDTVAVKERQPITQPLKWHGGKHNLAKPIVGLMPKHLHYVEPYAGGLAVLLERDPDDPRLSWGDASSERGVSEVVNDINGDLTNFWSVMANAEQFPTFQRIIEATPFSQPAWDRSAQPDDSPVVRAARFFVRCRQSWAGCMERFATLTRRRTRRGRNEQASAWLNAIDGLPAVHERLRRVVVLCDDAIKVIQKQDGPKTFFYLDPPYLHETRTSTNVYRHEMTERQHRDLLHTLAQVEGRFLLSGYPSELYDQFAQSHGWDWIDFNLANNAAGGAEKRRMTERVWANYELRGEAE